MDNIAGTPVEGDNFFGREGQIRDLQLKLRNNDILLLGPRRIGKTSIARQLMSRLRAEGWQAVEVNVASSVDERGFLDKLEDALRPRLASMLEKTTEAAAQTIDKVTKRIKSVKITIPGGPSVDTTLSHAEAEAEDWTAVASDLLRLIGRADGQWLIYVDELPIFLFSLIRNDPAHGVQRVRRFLDWFRNDVRALPAASRIRWLISGSVGLDTLVQEHGMADTINSLHHEALPPYTFEEAVALLQALADSYQMALSAGALADIVAAVRWPQPYYLQRIFANLLSLRAVQPAALPEALIPQAIERLMSPGNDNDFHHWEKRLEMQLSVPDAAHARALLDHAANDPQGSRPDTLLAVLAERMPAALSDDAKGTFIRLRDILIRDAYWFVDESSGARRYSFQLEPLRRWWLGRNTL